MAYEVSYIDGLAGNWIAGPTPTANAPIIPYRQGAGGGFAPQAPRMPTSNVGSPSAILDRALEAETYVTPTGARAWRPTASEDALVDAVTRNPYAGIDNLAGAGARGAGSGGLRRLPFVGDIAGGVVDGALAYGDTGSVPQGVGAGVGSAVGGIAGGAVGAAIGGIGGPVGAAVGGAVGGAIGAGIGRGIGQGIGDWVDGPPTVNPNGSATPGSFPYEGENSQGQLMQIYWDYKYQGTDWMSNQWVGVHDIYPYRVTTDPNAGCTDGAEYKSFALGTRGLASGCGAAIRNVRVSPWPSVSGKPLAPVVPPEPYKPDPVSPRIPRPIPFPLPQPQPGPNPTGRPAPTTRPTVDPTGQPSGDPRSMPDPRTGPTGQPVGGPTPIPGAPIVPDTGTPGRQPTSSPHPSPTGGGGTSNPNPVEYPPADEPQCDPCAELRYIKAKLDETFTLAWSLPDCGQDFPIERLGANEGKGLTGLSKKIDALYQTIKVIHQNTRCDKDNIVVIPDSWPIKAESNRPQLILLYADRKPDGTIGNRRYQFAIPHADGRLRKSLKAIVPKEIRKGSEQGTYVLKDNSKIITYCRDKTEAMRVINAFDRLVLSSKRTDNKKTGGINPSTRFLEINVYPYEARYFSRGQAQLTPDWKEKLI